MQNTNEPETKRPIRKQTNPLKPVLIFIVLILLLGGAALFLLQKPKETKPPAEVESLETVQQPLPPATEPEAEESAVAPPEPVTETVEEEPSSPEEPAAPGIVEESPEDKRAMECKILAEQIHGFFTHIDSEEYMKSFQLSEPSQAYFIDLANKLLKNPPVVARESDDLYTILKNMAHFFRVIGKDNIVLMKTILDRERDKIEDVMAELYQWTEWENCDNDTLQFSPSLEELYEYAGFFLNTMGGRSYLFRRDSRSRLLVNYYSVLIIERANTKGINRHGIDISQIIPQLVPEVEASNQLIYKENYIDSLFAIQEKYQ